MIRKIFFNRRWLVRWLARLAIAFAAAYGLLHILVRVVPYPESELRPQPSSALIYDCDDNLLRAYLDADEQRCFPVPLSEISPHLVSATLAVEDRRFRSHSGVDWLASCRAVGQLLWNRRIISGASTITMQLVRLHHPRPRTVRSKVIETFRAMQLEHLKTKDEIIGEYLNRAPYGGNMLGAEGAARAYFGKTARDLTLAEAALVAGLPQSPCRLRPDRHPERAKRRRNEVLRRMFRLGWIDGAAYEAAVETPVQLRPHKMPFRAPHFCDFVRTRYPKANQIRTTLDSAFQEIAERSLRRQVSRLRRRGVTNGAVVLLENRTGAVRAMAGSVDFFRKADGQVNGAVAARSAGSTLKPFTYALAFERGIILPSSILADVPFVQTGYAPENFDREFAGPISAADALVTSRNVPAVRLAQEVGLGPLWQVLRDCGITTLTRKAEHYGLSLALGSVEVRPLDLAAAYSVFARGGMFRPIAVLDAEAKENNSGQRIFSQGACHLIGEILSDTTRLAPGSIPARRGAFPKIAWKTGTSHGFRDAWCVGFNPEYTVVVWLGNFSGRPSAALVGVEAAAPVVVEIFGEMYRNRPAPWFERPSDVTEIEVCVASGMPANPLCGARRKSLALRSRSQAARCSVHRAFLVDSETGRVCCRCCRKNRRTERRVFEAWPPDVAVWLEAHGAGDRLAPPHHLDCPRLTEGDAPRILSPLSGQKYVLGAPASLRSGEKILLSCSGNGRAFWFVNGELFVEAAKDARVFWPASPGRHTITCADASGRSASCTIVVSSANE